MNTVGIDQRNMDGQRPAPSPPPNGRKSKRRTRDLALRAFQLEQEGRVLTATFVNPPVNLIDSDSLHDLDRLTRAVDRDPSVGAVVLELAGFVASQMSKASSVSLPALNADIKHLGDSPFVADPVPWIEGTRVKQTP